MGIIYDQIGNPLNDGEWTYTWQNGRQLVRMQKDGVDASFIYNENGLRVQKTVNGVVTNYTLHGKNVVHLTCGNDELHFFYDASSKPAVVVYNGVPYSYVKNLQGDIVAMLDSTGTVVVSYVYDAWGRPINKTGSMAATLGTVQPFRYRGYVYDEETGLYYLRNRYYNVNTSRFLNADIIYQGNVYAYCANSPIAFCDTTGRVLECCFDDNGHSCTFSTMVMGALGGGGTIGVVACGAPPAKELYNAAEAALADFFYVDFERVFRRIKRSWKNYSDFWMGIAQQIAPKIEQFLYEYSVIPSDSELYMEGVSILSLAGAKYFIQRCITVALKHKVAAWVGYMFGMTVSGVGIICIMGIAYSPKVSTFFTGETKETGDPFESIMNTLAVDGIKHGIDMSVPYPLNQIVNGFIDPPFFELFR